MQQDTIWMKAVGKQGQGTPVWGRRRSTDDISFP